MLSIVYIKKEEEEEEHKNKHHIFYFICVCIRRRLFPFFHLFLDRSVPYSAHSFIHPFHSIPSHSVPFRSVPFSSIPFHSIPFHSIPFLEADFEPFWALEWLPDDWRLILSCSGLWWPNGSQMTSGSRRLK